MCVRRRCRLRAVGGVLGSVVWLVRLIRRRWGGCGGLLTLSVLRSTTGAGGNRCGTFIYRSSRSLQAAQTRGDLSDESIEAVNDVLVAVSEAVAAVRTQFGLSPHEPAS
jgi:hypothetical protein